MYPYRSPYPVADQRFLGGLWGWPLAIGGLSFLGGLIGGGIGAWAAKPGGFGYPGFGYPGFGYPGFGYPGFGYPGYY
ncbi:hypothetical protein [Neobacillus fumarioli]|uniref:hypothetical protein n=1 Tax=Neobacillus fumarioli TaxID=105229 RepID=UPI000830A12D|nr:hypothetical protein [Neobacillus fumarioli]